LEQRITNYLSSGGLFNPELMEHDKVRELLIECRAALAALAPERFEYLISELAKAHNAALAAERNERRLRTAQLAAERERYESLEHSILDLSHPNCKDLLQQLAAAQAAINCMEIRAKNAEEALAAERESKEWQDAATKWLDSYFGSGLQQKKEAK
jgi:hypothetical protein